MRERGKHDGQSWILPNYRDPSSLTNQDLPVGPLVRSFSRPFKLCRKLENPLGDDGEAVTNHLTLPASRPHLCRSLLGLGRLPPRCFFHGQEHIYGFPRSPPITNTASAVVLCGSALERRMLVLGGCRTRIDGGTGRANIDCCTGIGKIVLSSQPVGISGNSQRRRRLMIHRH